MTKTYFFTLTILIALLCSCTQESPEVTEAKSGFYLNIDENNAVTSRSIPKDLTVPTPSMCKLRIVNNATGYVAYEGKYKQFVEAGNGTYTITATYGEDYPVAIDKPYYKGSAEATIDKNNTTPSVAVTCKIANALASFVYLDNSNTPQENTSVFDKYFTDYGVQVWHGEQYVTVMQGTTHSAYFRTDLKPVFKFVGKRKDNGATVSVTIPTDNMPNVEPACHYIMRMQFKVTGEVIAIIDKEYADNSDCL